MPELPPRGEEISASLPDKTKEILGPIEPDAFFVLSGGIKLKSAEGGDQGYKSLSYADSDTDYAGLVTGGKARVFAAAKIAKYFPESIIVTTSRVEENAPSHAQVMADELAFRGVPKERIVLEEKSRSTITELIEIVKMTISRNWHEVAIITSDYHLPRVREMLERLEDLSGDSDPDFTESWHEFRDQVKVDFIAAEAILESTNEHYKRLLAKVRDSEAYKQRLEAEKKGLGDLQAGRYKINRTH